MPAIVQKKSSPSREAVYSYCRRFFAVFPHLQSQPFRPPGVVAPTAFDSLKKEPDTHFLVFVSFLGNIADRNQLPEVYVVPSPELPPFVYHSPSDKRRVVNLSKMRKLGKRYRDAWHLVS
jgi:hypothetical protein